MVSLSTIYVLQVLAVLSLCLQNYTERYINQGHAADRGITTYIYTKGVSDSS